MIWLQVIDSVKNNSSWIKTITDYTAPVSNISAVLIALCGGLLWWYFKRKEVEYKVMELRAENFLNSHKAIWGLLKYLTNKDKPETIFLWNPDTKEWKFNTVNAQKFTGELNKIYYTDGNGIMLEKEVRETIFEIENKILKCLRNLGSNPPVIADIKNDTVCTEVRALKDKLIEGLRKLVSKRDLLEHSRI
jgi:Mg2+ and Co2+ transporter CorA